MYAGRLLLYTNTNIEIKHDSCAGDSIGRRIKQCYTRQNLQLDHLIREMESYTYIYIYNYIYIVMTSGRQFAIKINYMSNMSVGMVNDLTIM